MRHKNGLHLQEEVIAAFKKAHGDTYDYSMVQYSGNTTKVRIGCPVHGWFEQTPQGHKTGKGCLRCGEIQRSKSKKMTLEEFICRSTLKHGNKYDYSLVDLQNNSIKDKVKIICRIHGIFLQNAHPHTLGFGCKKCGDVYRGDRYKMTQEQFLAKAASTHGNKYDYSKTVYTYARKKITVTCKSHGDFKQVASSHAGGQGCPQCNQSKGELSISTWLESNHINYIREKRFGDCLSPMGNVMKFDFYLPLHNALVEFDGKHHYEEVEYFLYDLKQVQQYDEVKNQYAKKKGMPLLRIPFYSLKEVPALLEEFLGQITAAAA